MSKAVPRGDLFDACIEAIEAAEATYKKWTQGLTMRAAPESFVQMQIAEKLYNNKKKMG